MSCFFGHHWGEWKEADRYPINTFNRDVGKPVITGHIIIQECQCEHCGFKKFDKQKAKV